MLFYMKHQVPHLRAGSCRLYSSRSRQAASSKLIDSLLDKPTWSTKSMLPPKGSGLTGVEPISASQLDHLLKLSALPQPKDAAARANMMKDLTEQMHFVKTVQDIDTSNTMPLHNLTAEQEDEGELIYEEAIAEGEAMKAHQAEEPMDYTKLAARTRNRYYTVDGGLVTDAAEKQK